MTRWINLVAAVAMQICLGGIYAWSTFTPPLAEHYGLLKGQAAFVFGGMIFSFIAVMIGAGRLLERWPPRAVAAIGGLLFGGGYIIASYSGGHYWLILGGIAGVGGAGIGFGYVTALTTCIGWFPRQKGLITGIAVAGFGGGAILLSQAGEALLARGMDVLAIFRIVGLVYGGVIVACALLLSPPPGEHARIIRPDGGYAPIFRSPVFRMLLAGMFAGTFCGLLVIGNLKPIGIGLGLTAAEATAGVSAFALGNAAGRVSWGLFYDRRGFIAVPFSLLFLAIVTLALLLTFHPIYFLIICVAIGFNFGANQVLYAAEVATRFGPGTVAGVYPVLSLAYGVSGIAGAPTGGYIADLTGRFAPAIVLAALIALAGLAAVLLLSRRLIRR